MQFRHLSVKHKLATAFALLTAVVLVVSGVAIRALASEHQSFTHYVDQTAVRITMANDVLDAANARAISARNLVLVSAPSARATWCWSARRPTARSSRRPWRRRTRRSASR
ncbi:MCP four helix bundle domain-containing protein [Methylibium petroleiphilum]|uniref:MCP four helix bundle domain-containing protein n=1 Tax=Methylibium petroleiphilum TaxID=105560 RepID=UPI003D2D50D7